MKILREDSVDGDHQSLINILLQNPKDFHLKQKPSGIRENKMFTLDMREISISSAKADDNEAYISKGCRNISAVLCDI